MLASKKEWEKIEMREGKLGFLSNTKSHFFVNTESNFSCLIQRVNFMYWHEIGCDTVTFFLGNFLNIFFTRVLPFYMWKIYSKFH